MHQDPVMARAEEWATSAEPKRTPEWWITPFLSPFLYSTLELGCEVGHLRGFEHAVQINGQVGHYLGGFTTPCQDNCPTAQYMQWVRSERRGMCFGPAIQFKGAKAHITGERPVRQRHTLRPAQLLCCLLHPGPFSMTLR